jgi:hypothetical protein
VRTIQPDKHFFFFILFLFSLVFFSQNSLGQSIDSTRSGKSFGAGVMTNFNIFGDHYIAAYGSLNKKKHQFFVGGEYSYQNSSSYHSSDLYSVIFGYKKFFRIYENRVHGFVLAGLKGYYESNIFQIVNCDSSISDFNYNTKGLVTYGGVGLQLNIKRQFIIGLSATLGHGQGDEQEEWVWYYQVSSYPAYTGCFQRPYSTTRSSDFWEANVFLYIKYRFKTN